MADKFGSNPQDNFQVIDPASFLPAGWQAAYGDADDAQTAYDAVVQATEEAKASGEWNKALDIALGAVKALAFGAMV